MEKKEIKYKSLYTKYRIHLFIGVVCVVVLLVLITFNLNYNKYSLSKSDLLIEMVKERYPEEYKIAKANKNTIDSVILCMQMNLEDLDEYEKNMMLYFIERLKKIDNKGE